MPRSATIHRMTTASRTSSARPMAPMSPPLPRRWSITPSDLNWAVLGIGLIIAAMWVRHGGLGLFDSPLNALVAVGQLTALFGTYLALVGILLMSRAPSDQELAQLHRSVRLRQGIAGAVHRANQAGAKQ